MTRARQSPRSCCIKGCDGPVEGHDFCSKHYQRWRTYGHPLWVEAPKGDPESRFWSRVETTDSCWWWKGALNQDGYGSLRVSGKKVGAHRFSFELHKGPIPAGFEVDHLCRNRDCVNPDHLEAVTREENIRRGMGACAIHARKTHCPSGHPYTPENTMIVNNGRSRACRTCKNAQSRAAQRRRRATARNHS